MRLVTQPTNAIEVASLAAPQLTGPPWYRTRRNNGTIGVPRSALQSRIGRRARLVAVACPGRARTTAEPSTHVTRARSDLACHCRSFSTACRAPPRSQRRGQTSGSEILCRNPSDLLVPGRGPPAARGARGPARYRSMSRPRATSGCCRCAWARLGPDGERHR